MDKKSYLTPSEQEVYNLIRKKTGETTTTEEIKQLFPANANINRITSSLNKKGYLHRLLKNTYLINDEPGSPQIKNPLDIAQKIIPGYYAYSTALRIHELLDYEPHTIYTITKTKSREIQLGGYTLKYIASKKPSEDIILKDGHYATDKTKTIYDCLSKPQYAGLSETTKALYTNKGCEWKKLLGYFKKNASDSLCQRSGYTLELLKEKTGLKIPDEIIKYLKTRLRNNTRLIPTNKKPGKYDKKWKIMDNLGKENILGWHNG